jgi:hypothetical protein
MKEKPDAKRFALELVIYAALVLGYFFIVLHYLGDWFKDLFVHRRTMFAVMALVVMIGQAVGLEIVSSVLFALLVRRKEQK